MTRRDLITGAAALTAAAAVSNPGCSAAAKGGIKKSILITMLPKDLPFLERFKLAVELGFQAMEVQTVDDDAEAKQIKDAADKAGLRIHSVMNMAHWKYPLSSPNPADVEASIAGMEKSLHQAKLYQADTVLLVPAVVRADTTYEQAWDRSHEQVRKLIPLAEQLDVIIAIEEVWNRFLLTTADFVRYVDEFGTPIVQGYFDIGNIVHYGIPQFWINALGKRIVKVHLKDYNYKERKFVNLGEGDVDWKVCREAFAQIPFEGNATLELPGGDREYLADLSSRVDRLVLGRT